MSVENTKLCVSHAETDKFIENFYSNLTLNSIIYLEGEVGSGKTYFANKLASYFDVYDIQSSSFEKLSIYNKKVNLIHCDLYRNGNEDFYYNELDQHLVDPWIVLVEWPYSLFPIKECTHYLVQFTIIKFCKRLISSKQLS